MFNSDNLKIIPGTNPELKKKSEAVTDFKDPELQKFIQQMIKTLHSNNGAGLAAIQVGIPLRIFIAELDYNLLVAINPKLKNISKDRVSMEEGCLSFPGIFKQIERSKKITLQYFDENGEKKKIKAKGLLARIIQHEYDHLEGILFTERCKK